MRHTGFALLSVLATFAVAACSTTTTGSGGSSSGGSPDGGTAPVTPGTDAGGAETSTSLPPPSASEANVDLDGTCPAFSACGGSPQGTYDYTAGCVSDAVSAVKTQCPAADTSGLKVTVRGSLHFVGAALTRDAVSTTSGTIVLPATCSQGQCAAVESALKSAFDSATCTGSAACTCTVKRTDTTKDATTFAVSGNTLTTADGDSYAICVAGSSLKYQGRSAGAEDGLWELTKR
ncbi:MAG TPA: hypothetical protein VLT33_12025 [Labilithrix sp.]|nr:hypothetical protein [Labilithrix sp.]